MAKDYFILMQKTSHTSLFNPKRRNAVEARSKRIGLEDADFLVREAAIMMADRLNATNRDFDTVADLFSPFDVMHSFLENSKKTKQIITVMPNTGMAPSLQKNIILADREVLPFKSRSVNLITSVFGLHWSNDIPGTFAQIRNSLVEDGLFLAALPGDRTLFELRDALLEAESSINGNATLRVDPFGEVRQMGGLLQRAGFALPVVDSELLTVRYTSLKSLINDLRAMGATSCLNSNINFAPRNLFEETEKVYKEKYQDEDGKIRASFEIIFLSGWSPHASQQKPIKPGSAKNKLSDFIGNELKS